MIDNRIRIVGILLGMGAIILVSRLFFWQILKGGDLAKYARLQYLASEEIITSRGDILASDSAPLATSKVSWQIWAEPQKLKKDKLEVARLLAHSFAQGHEATTEAKLELIKNEQERLKKLLGGGRVWVLLGEKTSDENKRAIESLNLEGIGWTREDARFYPEATLAAHLLGFVGKSERGEQGYFGLEGFYDLTLAGKTGVKRSERDLRGNPIPFGLFSEIAPTPGADLLTFIDRSVQYMVEKHLAVGIEKYGAKGGSVVVMRLTGELIASASFPAYDPAHYSESNQSLFKNPLIADSFEPGSVFKILVMAGALDSGVVKPDTKCEECTGPVRIDKYTIHTWDNKYHPDSTATDIIVNSDNVGMVFLSKKLGQDRLWDYLHRFGIGRLSGVDLQEEASPKLRERGKWSIVDLATASFGQGIAVTPIQFVRAVGVIANRGVLPVPRVVAKIKSGPPDGRAGSWEQTIPTKDEGRVISEGTASQITEMMVAAVKKGEAKWAAPRGFRIAGKTGTAQIPIAGHYDPDKTVASFVGFAPANPEPVEGPKFVMLVTLREPTSSPWGSETAAPLWFSIARDLFPYFGIGPSQ